MRLVPVAKVTGCMFKVSFFKTEVSLQGKCFERRRGAGNTEIKLNGYAAEEQDHEAPYEQNVVFSKEAE